MPAGEAASGFTEDSISPKHSAVFASASHGGDTYNVRELQPRGASASNMSSTNSSYSGDRRSSSSSSSSSEHEKSVRHNHTYPLMPGQKNDRHRHRERNQRDDDDALRATRCRDQRKAKDMHVRSPSLLEFYLYNIALHRAKNFHAVLQPLSFFLAMNDGFLSPLMTMISLCHVFSHDCMCAVKMQLPVPSIFAIFSSHFEFESKILHRPTC